jgi:hypothetical protein
MAPKAKTSPERTPTNRPKFQFVRYEPDEEDKQAIKRASWDYDVMEAALIDLVESDYAVSIKWDTFNKCYAAFLTTQNKFSPNWNLCLSGRGSTPTKAFKQVYWKHCQCDKVWPAPDYTRGPDGEFDD